MARPMDRDPANPAMPLWLSQARRAAELAGRRAQDASGQKIRLIHRAAPQIEAETGLPLSRARDYMRLYDFLVDNYPAALSHEPFDASFPAVTHLLQIHRLSKDRADALAPEVFAGKLKAVHLRAVVDELLGNTSDFSSARRMLAKRRGADFVRHVINRVKADPDVLAIGAIDEIVTPPSNARFVPELVVRQGERWVAVEINIGGETASPYDVGRYLARLAQLEQKYDKAILVLPRGSDDMAEMARRFQREWIDRDVHVVLIEEPESQGAV